MTDWALPVPVAADPLAREPLDLAHLVGCVQRRDLVGLGQRRVVLHRIDQVVDCAATPHHSLPDVHELGAAGAEHVHPEQLPGVR